MAPPPILSRLQAILTRQTLNPRSISIAISAPFSSNTNFDPLSAPCTSSDDSLSNRLLRLRSAKRSATSTLEKWVGEGRDASAPQLRQVVRELSCSGQFKHALEVTEWMKVHHEPLLSGSDYGVQINLITKVFGPNQAEEFFTSLSENSKSCEAYTALLHSFASCKLIEKSENLLEQIKAANLELTALPFNEMMTLYVSVGQMEKAFEIIDEMKRLNVSLDIFSYNLLTSAYASRFDIDGVRRVLNQMESDPNNNQMWDIYKKLTLIYIDVGRFDGLVGSGVELVELEGDKKIGQREWITYDFLIILHASLGNKGKIDEIWKCLKMVSGKMSSRNYVCVISSYLMVGGLEEVARVMEQWKGAKEPEFDLSTCNRLVDAFVKANLVEIARNFKELLI